jgi:methylenetetrahydrofolate dehydrogenase (NADP+)/methenyltetrahydrofolate cyclohydrolase
MELLDGRALARKCNQALKAKIAELPRAPGLAVILVGEDPASEVYVTRKGRVAARLGLHHEQITLPATATIDEVLSEVDRLNETETVDGILVQLPLPAGLDSSMVMDRIRSDKDVDGFSVANTGLLAQGRPALVPCTPLGIMRLLESSNRELSGLRACVIGRSNIVGRPMVRLLEQANCTVTCCHSRSRNVDQIVSESDIVVAAVGRSGFVKGEWIKPGAIVLDVGINRMEDGSLTGDVEFEAASARASLITPVPGGVGPMTISMLMENTFKAYVSRSM